MNAEQALERANRAKQMIMAEQMRDLTAKFHTILNCIAEAADRAEFHCGVAVRYVDGSNFFKFMEYQKYKIYDAKSLEQITSEYDFCQYFQSPDHTVVFEIYWN